MNTSRLYTAGVLSVNLADGCNGNCVVDLADDIVWRKGLGTTYMQTDYNVWRSHFGQTVGSGGVTNSAVPEPSTPIL